MALKHKITHTLLISLLLLLPQLTFSSQISYWDCDEASGVRYDSNLTLTNDLTDNNTVLSATGKLNNACVFEDSLSEYLSITDGTQTNLDTPSGICVMYWVKPQSQPANNLGFFAISKWTGGSGAYAFGYTNYSNTKQLTGIFFDNDDPSTNVNFSKNATLSNATWYFIAQGYNPTTNIYEAWSNAVSVGTTTGGGTVNQLNNSTGSFYLGQYQTTSGYYMDGDMDEIEIWNEPCTQTMVTLSYNSGTPAGYGYDVVEEEATTTATSTLNTGDIVYSLSVIISMLTILLCGFIWSIFNKRK